MKIKKFIILMIVLTTVNPCMAQLSPGFYLLYPDEKEKVFKHHALQPYLYLLEKQYPK
jgi:hypothetical protein